MNLRTSLLLLCVCALVASCNFGANRGYANKEKEISVFRYDKLLSEYVRSNSFSAWQKMNMEYSQPTKILIEDVLSIGSIMDDTISQKLQNYYSDTTLLRLIRDVDNKFPNLDEVEEGLNKGFKKLKKEVPDVKIPFIYSQVSAFNESIVLVDSLMGISLDKYMGEDYPLYKRFYYDYQCRSMRPDRIVPDCFVFYLQNRYRMDYHDGICLLDAMMHYGKINYVVKKVLGYKDTGATMGYTENENDWCKKYEKEIWNYIRTNNHLYARDPMVVRKYMKPSPSIDMFGDSVPALIGTWMGTQIIDSYMKCHKDLNIKDLLEITDYHKMYDESGYL